MQTVSIYYCLKSHNQSECWNTRMMDFSILAVYKIQFDEISKNYSTITAKFFVKYKFHIA